MLRFALFAGPTVLVIVAALDCYRLHRGRSGLARRLQRLELEVSLKQEFLQAGMTAAESSIFANLLAHVIRHAFSSEARISAAELQRPLHLQLIDEGDSVVVQVVEAADHLPGPATDFCVKLRDSKPCPSRAS
ncbi:MAG: hypothetical protein HY000_21595 [Planctomycetes bacterium]|nr:hypothetical protein [Planctomycetota bacterium]